MTYSPGKIWFDMKPKPEPETKRQIDRVGKLKVYFAKNRYIFENFGILQFCVSFCKKCKSGMIMVEKPAGGWEAVK